MNYSASSRLPVLFVICLVLTGSWPPHAGASEYGAPISAISTRKAGQLLLELVNAERGAHGLSQLALSAPASRLAREHARDMAQHGYVGHYDLAGRKCELRYNLLGETDYVAENIAYREVGARVRLTPQLVQSIFADWLGSKSHRDNILDSAHTHMGYGFATVSTASVTKVYALQEFVNDWGDYDRLPLTARPGQRLRLHGVFAPGGMTVAFASLGLEPPPPSRTPALVGEADLHYRQPRVSQIIGAPDLTAPLSYPDGPQPQLVVAPVQLAMGGREFTTIVMLPQVDTPTDVYVDVWGRGAGNDVPVHVMTQVVMVEPAM